MDEIERMMRMMDALMDYLSEDLYDREKRALKPLTHIIETDDEIIVTVDLPCISSKDDVSIKSTEDTLTIRANLNKIRSLDTRFECYNKSIKLPSKVDPKYAKAYFNNGVLQIRLAKKIEGSEIKVE